MKPVLVVGAGPVGMTMASELARYGVPVRIVDKAAQRTDKSKALVVWSRTLELLDRGGGSAPFVDAGFKTEAVNFIAGDKVIGRVSMEGVRTPYPFGLMLPQSETERLLEERLHAPGRRRRASGGARHIPERRRRRRSGAAARRRATRRPCRRIGWSGATGPTAPCATAWPPPSRGRR